MTKSLNLNPLYYCTEFLYSRIKKKETTVNSVNHGILKDFEKLLLSQSV